ncbi:MAG: SPFH domain-containing protein [Clostridia bacterium]|nr:SPFH domain-containing protein [Clostridia bacterium]
MKEKIVWRINGFVALVLMLLLLAGLIYSFIRLEFVLGSVLTFVFIVVAAGLQIVQPNQSAVLTFFGRYVGSIREAGFWFTIPFCVSKKVSLRVRNFNTEKIKVNDVEGNPIEIAAVNVIKVVDAAKAAFDVDDYEEFVKIQSEAALRHVATKYPYDIFEENGSSLRANTEEVAAEIATELQNRLALAGVEVIEARLTHLAYATEIASAMLQRQQATAIIAARQKIVEGAVGMAQMAIEQLLRDGTVELDEERKVAMVNNLLVAIVSDRSAQPVLNTGSLY